MNRQLGESMDICRVKAGSRRAAGCRRRLRALGASVVCVVLAASCGSQITSSARARTALKTSSAGATPFVRVEVETFPSRPEFNYYNAGYIWEPTSGLVVLPLTWQGTKSVQSYIPAVATSWNLEGRTLVVHIRNMKWQNGRPVTATDVIDSMLLNGIDSNGVWEDITTLNAPNPREVVFHLANNVAAVPAEQAILQSFVFAHQLYKRFLPPTITKTVETYWSLYRRDPTAASKSAAGKVIAKELKGLASFHISSSVGDGPFRFKSETTSEIKLVKSPTFYGAKKVHVSVYEEQAISGGNLGAITTGITDFTASGLAVDAYKAYLQGSNHHINYVPSYNQYDLLFNNHKAPFNDVAVRQALVYILHRPSITKLMGGSLPIYSYVPDPALLYKDSQYHYLSKSQIGSLNPYRYSPKKATQLLESQGFHRRNGTWLLPNGKPFEAPILISSADTDAIPAYQVFSSWLKGFGIKSNLDVEADTGANAAMEDGNFDIAARFTAGVDPLSFMAGLLGPSFNYIGSGERGLGFGPVMNVPGLGKVNVPETITKEASQVNYGPQMNSLVWDWTKFLNKEVPVMDFADRNWALLFNTTRFSDWPPNSSPLWGALALANYSAIGAFFAEGYIRPRN